MDSQLIAGYGFEQADEAGLKRHEIVPPTHIGSQTHKDKKSSLGDDVVEEKVDQVDGDYDYNVSDDDRINLRRIPAPIPWTAFLVAVCELAERFSYYGTTQVFQNYIQNPLPAGSTTGNVINDPNGTAGALGKGQQAATGLTTFNTFWVYTMPLVGGWLADTHLGRYNTVCLGVAIALVGHLLFIISALPPVLKHSDSAMAPFVIGVIINGIGTGFFKSTVSPLIAEQIKAERQYIQVTKKGERVIVDPTVTAARLFDFFYLMINIGAIGGQVAMPFAEHGTGYWLAYLIPTLVFLICIPVLFFARKRYVKTPPSGSVLSNALKLLMLANKGRWSWNPVQYIRNVQGRDFWDNVKPSYLGANKPTWMTFDDAWVEEVRRGFKACYVFLLFPFYWLCYNQISGNLISQGASMTLNGVPNEIPSNLDPLSIIIFVPLFEYGLYPALRRMGIKFTALKKIFSGFMFASAGMVWAAVLQYYIYQTSNCGYYASGDNCTSPLSVWIQVGPYSFIGISELFASVVSLEYAYTKAPRNMRSLVMAVGLFTTAIGSAIQEAFIPLVKDPLLIWMYTSFACIAFVAGILFAILYRGIDKEEDYLNNLAKSKYHDGRKQEHEAWDMEQNSNAHSSTQNVHAAPSEKA